MRKTALDSIYNLAKNDRRVVFIGSDLGPGVLNEMKKNIPSNFFMEGVSEQHIIGMAAGLALEGFIPFVNTIATFLTRRCFEQVAIDLCLQDLPVRLIANGGGLVYAPLGPTHLATEDISIMRALPNMTVVAPCDAEEMKRLMSASMHWPHPIYIRLGKGGERIISEEKYGFEIGKAIPLKNGSDCLIISTGVMTQLALEAADILSSEGIECGVLHLHTIKPLDGDALSMHVQHAKAVVTVEEHAKIGGLGSAVLEYCSEFMPKHAHKITRLGLPDQFVDQYGSQNSLLAHFGITPESICLEMKRKIGDCDVS